MNCTNPVNLNGVELQCGKCIACRIAKSNEWGTRIYHELDYYPESCFLTLTYDEEHLPDDYGLHKKHLQDFFKRLRKNTGKKIKYYAVGEYGENYDRPHYHCIMLAIDRDWETKSPSMIFS